MIFRCFGVNFHNKFDKKLQILVNDYGRDWGWLVVRDHETVATLFNPSWSDMFWTHYQINLNCSFDDVFDVSKDPELENLIILQSDCRIVNAKTYELIDPLLFVNKESTGACSSSVRMRNDYIPVSFSLFEKSWLLIRYPKVFFSYLG